MESKQNKSSGTSFLGLLAILFITLKLTGVINWSWWYVTMPLYAPLVIAIIGLIIFLIVAGITNIVASYKERN